MGVLLTLVHEYVSSMPSVPSLVCLFLSIGIIFLCIRYPNRYVGTYVHPDIPGPKGIPLFGNFFQIIPHIHRMTYWMDEMAAIYGPLYTFTMPGWRRSIVINHPDWLEHVKKQDTTRYTKGSITIPIFNEFPGPMSPFANDGIQWRARRKLISPIFSVKNFDAQVSSAMQEVVSVARDMLLSAADKNMVFDWNNFSGRLAISMLYRMAFGIDSGVLTNDPICLSEPDSLVNSMHICNTTSSGRLYNPFWRITDNLTGVASRFRTARANLFKIADSVISDRKGHTPSEAHDGGFLDALFTNGMSDIDIRDTMITLFFAGHDNFLNVLGWSLLELSRSPLWISRMREEAHEQNPSGVVITYSDISKYPVHLAVFYETLRLWPGVPKNARYIEDDDVLPAIPALGIGPIKVYKGEYVLWSDRAMMRSIEVWGDDADKFDPGRHLDNKRGFVKPRLPKFHSFGAGPRYCPGAQLGTYEFVALWSAILPCVDVQPVTREMRQMKDSFTSTMDGSLYVIVQRRASST